MDTSSPPERLEQNEILTFIPCPFPLPDAAECDFLYRQQEGGLTHKNISLNPHSGELTGFVWQSAEQAARLRQIMERFSHAAESWLAQLLPGYADGWRKDRVSYRPAEEATRRLRQNARNDLLHVDAFPSRPTGGARILRLYVNLHPKDPCVWATSDSFADVIGRFADQLERSGSQWSSKLREGIQRLLQPRQTEYDAFMLRLHHFLKSHDPFQETARKKVRHFAPGTAWLAFTDGICHAELRGRFTLEHSFFVHRQQLALPQLAPVTLWQNRHTTTLAA